MFFFRKKRLMKDAAVEKHIKSLKQKNERDIAEAAEKIKRLNKLLENKEDIARNIFYATGGDRRRRVR